MSLPVPKQGEGKQDMPLTPESFLELGPPTRFEAAVKQRQATTQLNIATPPSFALSPWTHQQVQDTVSSHANKATLPSSALSQSGYQQAEDSVPSQRFNAEHWEIKDELKLMQLVANFLAEGAKAISWTHISAKFNNGERQHRPPLDLESKHRNLSRLGVSIASLQQRLDTVPGPKATATTAAPVGTRWTIEEELKLMKLVADLPAEDAKRIPWSQIYSDFNDSRRPQDALHGKYHRLCRAGETVASLEQKLANRRTTGAPP
jgi:hypothetical protein